MDPKFSCDVNMEILSRTSLKTLDITRCINKQFEKLTYDPGFLNFYKKRNKIVSGFLIQKGGNGYEFAPGPESNNLDLGFLPHDAKILASSEQGIMVFESPHLQLQDSIVYHVCKPSSKQVLPLPYPKTSYTTDNVYMVVVDSKPLHYKIVRLSDYTSDTDYGNGRCTSYHCEIFDSREWTWRVKDHVILPYTVYIKSNYQWITTRGSIYMLLSNKEVLKFDAYFEEWTTFSTPIQTLYYPFSENPRLRKLVKYQGKLGFACMTPSFRSWEIWVLTVDQSWEKLDVLDMKKDIAKLSLVAIYDADTWVMNEFKTLVFYSFKEGGCISKARKSYGGYSPIRILPFRSDFEPIDLKPVDLKG
ncbi:unnamed protein product [Lactuca saligna]|uniref:F-box associated beta-propeller type 3 domain-containing protein n=1 Tax=Lactuca saligna TaxID=75948 RepID=A0AA35VLT9_LACSI|nr:unnamed protein product [Lactuca saligna]